MWHLCTLLSNVPVPVAGLMADKEKHEVVSTLSTTDSAAHTVYTKHQTTKRVGMGTGSSRHEPEVHVVVVQSHENGKVMDAKVLRQSLSTIRTRPREKRGACVCVCTDIYDEWKPGYKTVYVCCTSP